MRSGLLLLAIGAALAGFGAYVVAQTVFLFLEYMVSSGTATWTGGLETAAHVGEAFIAVIAVLLSVLAGVTGLESLLNSEDLPPGANLAAGAGVLSSFVAAGVGTFDIFNLAGR